MLRHFAVAVGVAAVFALAPLPTLAQSTFHASEPDFAGKPSARDRDAEINVAQSTLAQRQQRPVSAASVGEAEIINRANAWTIGLAAGLPEGTFLPFAAEIARNLNDGNELRVLPMVTPGATDNVRDLLYLKGVDVAITATDVFDHFRTVEKISNIERRVNYITGLYQGDCMNL